MGTHGEPLSPGDTSGTPVEVLDNRSSETAYGYSITDVSGDAPVTVDSINSSLLSDASLELVFGTSAPNSSEVSGAWNQPFGGASWTKELTVYVGDDKKAPVGVTVKLESSAIGASMSFTFKDQEEGNEHYSVSFTLRLQSGAAPVSGSSEIKDEVHAQYVKTDTKTNRLVWAASDIGSGS